MKLATLNDRTRDGKLVVVSRDLSRAVAVPDIAMTLQEALDEWHVISPKLVECYQKLNTGEISDTIAFDASLTLSPLPRAFHWADGSAYVNHVELVRKARGAEMPESFWHDPLIYQGGSDTFLAPHENIPLLDESSGLDFEAEIAVITTDVPMTIKPASAGRYICLLMLVNDISLRNLIPGELAKGFGFYQSKPSTAFSPVVVTPDELGSAWDGGKVSLPLISTLNGKIFGSPNAGVDMTFDFPALISHAAKTRKLAAGTIIGSGTVSNYDRSKGSSCIAERRMIETLENGKPLTPYLKPNDVIRIEMFDDHQNSIFGAIEQKVVLIKEHEKIC